MTGAGVTDGAGVLTVAGVTEGAGVLTGAGVFTGTGVLTGAGVKFGLYTGAFVAISVVGAVCGVAVGVAESCAVASCCPVKRMRSHDFRKWIITFVASGSEVIEQHVVITA